MALPLSLPHVVPQERVHASPSCGPRSHPKVGCSTRGRFVHSQIVSRRRTCLRVLEDRATGYNANEV
eukprot:5244295-Pyramimonas_sp.AAC.1